MNRNLFALGLLLTVLGTAHAQFGLTAGLNFATLVTKTSDEHHHATAQGRPGYQLGVFYEKRVSPRWSGLVGLNYRRQATDLSVEEYGIADGGYAGSYRLDLSYSNLPVLARATWGHFCLEAGPQLGVLQSAHEKGTEVFGTFGGSIQRDFDRPATDHYRRVDLSLCAGLGLRAYSGLLSLTHVPQPTYAGPLRNQVVRASLSYTRREVECENRLAGVATRPFASWR